MAVFNFGAPRGFFFVFFFIKQLINFSDEAYSSCQFFFYFFKLKIKNRTKWKKESGVGHLVVEEE